jgi:hypothetical protein
MTTKIWSAIAIVAALALGFVYGSRRPASDLTVPVVRTYMVPPERADEIKAQLNVLMSPGTANTEVLGRAQVFNNGLMIVRAPEGYQNGIHKLIEQLKTTTPPPRNAVHLDYWLVMGQEDKTSNADEIKPLAQALNAITDVDGPRKFHVLEHLGSNSISGQEIQIKGAVSEAQSVAMLSPELVRLKVEFKSKLGQVRGETQIKPGEFLVIGQNAVNAEAQIPGLKLANAAANVYYVVHAELAK